MKRLPGVIVTAVLLIIGSLFQLLVAVLMGFSALIEHRGLPSAANSTVSAPPAWLPWFSLGLAAVCVGLAAWEIVTSVGLFRMRRWARYSVLIIGGCIAVFGVPSTLMMLVMTLVPFPIPAAANPAQAHTMQLVIKITFVVMSLLYAAISAIGIWWLVYFNRKAVREAFAGASGTFFPSRRPVLISVLAVLNIFGAAMCVLMAFIPFPLAVFGFVVHSLARGAVLLAFALFVGIAGVGLWRLREWGRRTAIALQCVGLINCILFILRPSVMQRYQDEVNQFLGVPSTQALSPQFQTMMNLASFGLGILVIFATIVILHYYRGAFIQPSNPASAQPELVG